MAKYYYNGVLLPEIPTEHLETNPYIFIRDNSSSGYYDLFMCSGKLYDSSGIRYDDTTTSIQYMYRLSKSSYLDATEWIFNKEVSNTYFVTSSSQVVLWSNDDVLNGSSTSTDVYFAGSRAILENERLISVEKIEAETGTLTGSAVVYDRTSTSGNVVVDCIQASTAGTLTLNFTVPKSDYYVIRMYFTHRGTRDFKYVLNGKTYLQSAVGTSYYLIETVDFQMYLNEGSNSVLFKGGTTTYAPMFDSFEILKISTNITKYLVRNNNDTIYTVTDGSLVEVSGEINSNLFIDNGVDDIPDGALLMTLSNPEVLCWTNDEILPTLVATVQGTPQPQIIISDKIHLTDKSITGIESALATCEGDLVVAVSFDDKQTWKAWNGEQWATLSDDNTGMSKETLEGITFEQWNELYTGATGFYVRVSLLDATQSVEKIVFDFAN